MRADPRATDVVGAIVSVVGAGRPVGFVIVQTGTCPVAGVRVGAVIVRGITAGRTRCQIRMGTDAARAHIVGTLISVVGARRPVGEVGMRAFPRGTNIVGTFVAVIRAGRPVGLVVAEADPRAIARIWGGTVIRGRIAAGRTRGQVRVSADPCRAHIVRAVICVVGACCPVGLVIVQARACSVAGIRVRAIVVRGITAGRPRRIIRMRTDTCGTDVVGAIATIIRTARSIRFMIVQAGPSAIARIRVRAIIVGGVTTGRASRQVRMGADAGATDVIGAIVSIIGTGRSVGFVIVQARARSITRIRVRAIIVVGITTG